MDNSRAGVCTGRLAADPFATTFYASVGFFCMSLSCAADTNGCNAKPFRLWSTYVKTGRVSAYTRVYGSWWDGRKQDPLSVNITCNMWGRSSANSRIDQQNGSRKPGHDLQSDVYEVAKSAEARGVRQTTVARAIETVSALPTRH